MSRSFTMVASLRIGLFAWLLLIAAGCDSDTVGDEQVDESILVTGIHVTTTVEQEGTGEMLGAPSYPAQGRLVPVPNPYIAQLPECRPEPFSCGGPEQTIRFTKVPTGFSVRVYRATASGSGREATVTLEAIKRLVADSVAVGTIPPPSSEGTLVWSLGFLPEGKKSGLYRAVLFDEASVPVEWSDLYVIHSGDFDTWVDPTGWLPANWREIYKRGVDVGKLH